MTFEFRGQTFDPYHHTYNLTHLNERAVELAIVQAWLDPWARHRLEVGNVLGHYPIRAPRTVVDRYEQAPDVVNCDVFDIGGRWDEIVSISTIEHVRWDEEQREPGGSQQAIEHLRSLLDPAGRMIVTIPTGHNPPLDEWLATGAGASWWTLMGRAGDGWAETAEFRPYGLTQPWAEAVWVGEFGRQP